MQRGRQVQIILALVLGVSAISAAFAVASGGGGIKSASAGGSLAEYPAVDSATAECPDGLTAISGGFTTPSYDVTYDESQISAYVSQRAGGGSWKTSSYNTGNASGNYTGYVYCARGISIGTKSASATVSTGPGVRSATATCPKNRQVISGGFGTPVFDPAFTGPNTQPVNSVKSGPRSWTVKSVNFGGAEGTMRAFAYCSAKGVTKKSASKQVMPDPAKATVAASCDAGRHVVSGGYAAPNFDPTFPNPTGAQIAVWSSHRTGARTWTIKAANFGPAAGTIKVFAYCQKN